MTELVALQVLRRRLRSHHLWLPCFLIGDLTIWRHTQETHRQTDCGKTLQDAASIWTTGGWCKTSSHFMNKSVVMMYWIYWVWRFGDQIFHRWVHFGSQVPVESMCEDSIGASQKVRHLRQSSCVGDAWALWVVLCTVQTTRSTLWQAGCCMRNKSCDMWPVLVQFQVDSGQRVHWLERATGGGCPLLFFWQHVSS